LITWSSYWRKLWKQTQYMAYIYIWNIIQYEDPQHRESTDLIELKNTMVQLHRGGLAADSFWYLATIQKERRQWLGRFRAVCKQWSTTCSTFASRFTLSFTRCRYCRHCRMHAACASMSTTTTTTTTTRDRGDHYGPMEWAQQTLSTTSHNVSGIPNNAQPTSKTTTNVSWPFIQENFDKLVSEKNHSPTYSLSF